MPWSGRCDAIKEKSSVSHEVLNDDVGGSAYLDRAEQRDQRSPLLFAHALLDSIRMEQLSSTHGRLQHSSNLHQSARFVPQAHAQIGTGLGTERFTAGTSGLVSPSVEGLFFFFFFGGLSFRSYEYAAIVFSYSKVMDL